ncbi:ATP-binding protein [Acanthopleuribacter pedis]|uniref:histidine kinase n=1 Tax=Acanthopleuribacter pedis TaxID=442870 RepID=A0A8J7U6G9_9BACT|nr:HAMP domain-containing histidine kinase [Acanthopleuribacter pedis]
MEATAFQLEPVAHVPQMWLDRHFIIQKTAGLGESFFDGDQPLVGASFETRFLPIPAEAHTADKPFSLCRDFDAFTLVFRFRPATEPHPWAWHLYLHRLDEEQTVSKHQTRLLEMATVNEVLPTFLHELKNPLASVMAMCELVLEDDLPEDQRELLAGIYHESQRMKLAFDGIGSVSQKLTHNEVQDIGMALLETCAVFRPLLERLGVDLVVDLDPLPPLPLETGGIRGMLFNLLNNAKQACQPGDQIRVQAGLDDAGCFSFEVRDTGIGMDAETVSQCTDLFYTTKSMGSGIGMAMCRAALAAHNGRLTIQSAPGEGTAVRAAIPLEGHHERPRAAGRD